MSWRTVKSIQIRREYLSCQETIRRYLYQKMMNVDKLSILIHQPSRPPQSSKNPHFQTEAKCTFLVITSFICMRVENHFHIKGWALHLVLIQRPGGTRKCPVNLYWALQRYTCDLNNTFWLIMEIINELYKIALLYFRFEWFGTSPLLQ